MQTTSITTANVQITTNRPLSVSHIRSLAFAWGIGHAASFGRLVIFELGSTRKFTVPLATTSTGYLSDECTEALSRVLNTLKQSDKWQSGYAVTFQAFKAGEVTE